jgi:hypothetical protein
VVHWRVHGRVHSCVMARGYQVRSAVATHRALVVHLAVPSVFGLQAPQTERVPPAVM